METKENQGCVQIYCGDGKGKTTAALGPARRAAGHGWAVLVVQFLKSGPTGELESLAKLESVQVLRGTEPLGFTFRMTPEEKAHCRQVQQGLWQQMQQLLSQTQPRLLVLDEVFGAISTGMLDEAQLLSLLQNRPRALEVVLTGRGPSPAVQELADYITEMRKVKHPFDQGLSAREGIEW